MHDLVGTGLRKKHSTRSVRFVHLDHNKAFTTVLTRLLHHFMSFISSIVYSHCLLISYICMYKKYTF